MSTYKDIQAYVNFKYVFVPKTCWIALMKELRGLNVKRVHPCPENKMFSTHKNIDHKPT